MSTRKFLGSNTQRKSRKIFDERARYRNFAIPSKFLNENPDLFRDFWFIENMYYGRIDFEHRFLMARSDLLVPLESPGGNSVVVFNFVADAFNDFIKDYEKAISSGKISKDDDFLSNVGAAKGYTSPEKGYDLHLTAIRNSFQQVLFRDHRRIEDFDDFIDYFLEYITLSKDRTPVTLTGFMASRFCSPLSTGLFVDMSNLDYGLDNDKVNKFIDRPTYEFFMKNCLKLGFMIDKNVPCRIFATLGSVEMVKDKVNFDNTIAYVVHE